ncbi:hypothetical protein BsWGS_02733 [Bradybaena similaris]
MMIKLNPGVFLFTLQLCAVYVIVGIYGELSDMKIVEEPSSFGLGNSFGHVSLHRDDTLQLRIQPANFSGPPHFKRLLGRCFSSVINDYKYKLCPFSNITQHEQGIHWNPYKGVLGVWQEWEVVNNTFVAMVMRDGDSCGRIYRSLKVTFMCGNHSQIVNVSEPKTCCYHLVFMTPLVCHPDSMLVYPTLSPDLQKQWDSLEGVMARGELTAKGYKKRLDNILEKAGIYLSSEFRAQLLKDSEDVNKVKDRPFDSVDKCQEEVEKLKERIKNLTSLLGVSDHSDQNTARNTTQIHFDG